MAVDQRVVGKTLMQNFNGVSGLKQRFRLLWRWPTLHESIRSSGKDNGNDFVGQSNLALRKADCSGAFCELGEYDEEGNSFLEGGMNRIGWNRFKQYPMPQVPGDGHGTKLTSWHANRLRQL